MRNLARAGLLLAVVTASIPAKAADDRPKGPLVVTGVGNESCGEYLQAVEGEKKARPPNPDPEGTYSVRYGAYLDFTDGFLTGANFTDATRRFIGQGTDHAGRMVWLENYCRANPVAVFFVAVSKLHEYLAGQAR